MERKQKLLKRIIAISLMAFTFILSFQLIRPKAYIPDKIMISGVEFRKMVIFKNCIGQEIMKIQLIIFWI